MALMVIAPGCTPYIYQAEFYARAGSVKRADLLGPYTGRVIDAATGRPVQGAVVFGSWEVIRGHGFVVPAGKATYTDVTDENGDYRIEKLPRLPMGVSRAIARFRIVIYRRGFVAYRSDRIFPGDKRRFDFFQLGNHVKLERWNPEMSRVEHVRFIGGAGKLAKAAAWETHAAVAEIEGRPYKPAPTGKPSTPEEKLLNVHGLLGEDDIKTVTGFSGSFEEGRLKDLPRTDRYDSKHFRATGKGERFDLAFRVWRLGQRGARAHYQKLLRAYPNVSARDEVGSRSFRSQNENIAAVVWLHDPKGIVFALTCGRGLCTQFDHTVKIAQIIHRQRKKIRFGESVTPKVPGVQFNPFKPTRPRAPLLQP